MTSLFTGTSIAITAARCLCALIAALSAAALLAAEPKASVVNEIQVSDADKYQEYTAQVPATLLPYGGAFIVRGGNGTILSGVELAGRLAIVEFPSRAKALEWHESADYQRILKIRNLSSTSRVYIVDEVSP
jgi:uncharacterized protein (DUF1330 family)